jgi:hypothetical protein
MQRITRWDYLKEFAKNGVARRIRKSENNHDPYLKDFYRGYIGAMQDILEEMEACEKRGSNAPK